MAQSFPTNCTRDSALSQSADERIILRANYDALMEARRWVRENQINYEKFRKTQKDAVESFDQTPEDPDQD
jgi:hypothetical protein